MSDVLEFSCRGAPRDLGLDQGRIDPKAVRTEARHARGDAEIDRSVVRDLRRFFPHLSERMEGLTRGAGVSPAGLATLLTRELALENDRLRRSSAGLGLAITAERSSAGPLLARLIDLPRERPPVLRVRRSLPESDYRSVEVVLPWALSPLAGVNEHGLAASVTSIPPGRSALEDCLAPAALLAQECLQRFDRVDKALEWCERRPAGGSASILLADAEGDVASVTVDGRRRRRRHPAQGVLVGSGRTLRCATVEKACLEAEEIDREALYEILRSHDGTPRGDDDSTCRHGDESSTRGLIILEPREGRLSLVDEAPCRADASALRTFSV